MFDELTVSQRESLLAQIRRLQQDTHQQLNALHQQSTPVVLDQQSVGRVSRIDAIQHQQMAQANETHMRQQLKRIQQILTIPEDYGYCLSCGESIGYPRLNIHPIADHCISCQSTKE